MKGCRTQSFETTLIKSSTSIEIFNLVLDFFSEFRENLNASMLNTDIINKLLHQSHIISKRIENYIDNQGKFINFINDCFFCKFSKMIS